MSILEPFNPTPRADGSSVLPPDVLDVHRRLEAAAARSSWPRSVESAW